MKNSTKEQSIREVTELRRRVAELEARHKDKDNAALLDEKSKSEAILSAIGEGISIQAVNFRVLYQNKIHKDIVGDHIGELCYKAYRQKDEICEDCPMSLSFKDGKIHKVERHVATEKGMLHIAVTASPIRNAKGEIIAGIEVVRDISKRKLAEEALKATNIRIQALIEAIPDVVIFKDAQGRHLSANKAVAEVSGLRPEEIIGKTAEEILPPDLAEYCRKSDDEVLGKKVSIHFEEQLTGIDGKKKFFDTIKTPIFDDAGNVVGLVGVSRNITERKAAEQALYESMTKAEEERSKSEAIIAAIADGISIQDTNFKILYQNQIHKDLAGSHTGEYCFRAYAKIDHICEGCPIVEAFKDGNIHTLEKTGANEKGTFHVEIKASPLRDSTGNIMAGIEVVRNITERKNMEESLRESEEKYRTLISHIQDGVFVIHDAKMQFVNEAFAGMIGYTVEELTGMDFRKLVAPEDMEMVSERYHRRQAGEDIPREYEFSLLHKDGDTMINVNMNVGIINFQGAVASVGTIKNITDRKKIEFETQKINKLESLGILAGGIAHDFNNILTAIAGNIALAKMYAKPGLEIFDILTEAEKASLRAKNLAKQLLTFSKGGTPIKKPVSVTKLMTDSVNSVLSGSFIRCEFHIPDNIWPVEADEGQIGQAVNNLVNNSCHAMPDGGIISITAENITAEKGHPVPIKSGNYVKIIIKDQGIGIREEHLTRIFDPYFTTKQEGSGLGLATVYSIIKRHDGYITAESTLGVGTTFYIYLPASKEKTSTPKDVRKYSAAAANLGKVLIMDDDEIVRLVMGRMLNQCGYEVDFAEDGLKAIDLYKKARDSGRPFDAVIIDLIIPKGMGGKETIKKLLEIDPDVKAIVSSGYSDDKVIANHKEYGFKDALPKPYELAELKEVLNRVITDGEKT